MPLVCIPLLQSYGHQGHTQVQKKLQETLSFVKLHITRKKPWNYWRLLEQRSTTALQSCRMAWRGGGTLNFGYGGRSHNWRYLDFLVTETNKGQGFD